MPKEIPTILAVNPGSRYLGFAAFRGPDLLDWGVRVVSAKTPRGRVRVAGRIVREAIDRFRPDALALKRLHPSRTSAPLDGLVASVRKLSRRRRIALYQYSIGQLKTTLCSDERGNKCRLAASLADTYPALIPEFRREMVNRHPYYLRMFEAVALGVVCYRQSSL